MNVVLPGDSNTSESAREEWVWSLSMLTRSLTTKAIGFLAMAHASTPAAWNDVIAALGADGRFQGGYMAEQRRLLQERRAAAAAGPGPGSFDATVTPITAWGHVASDIADADLAERLAKALANTTTTTDGGTADVMRPRCDYERRLGARANMRERVPLPQVFGRPNPAFSLG